MASFVNTAFDSEHLWHICSFGLGSGLFSPPLGIRCKVTSGNTKETTLSPVWRTADIFFEWRVNRYTNKPVSEPM